MSDKPFGIDVSRWQGNINWDAVAINKMNVKFVGIRATISWGYVDGWFSRNWTEAKRVGLLRSAYHVVYPGIGAQRQCDNFLKTVGDDLGKLPLTLDVELDHDLSPEKVLDTVYQCSVYLKAKTGKRPMIYTRAGFVNGYMLEKGQTPPDWFNLHYWWLAQYLRTPEEHPGPPDLPNGVNRDRCLIHQTSGTAAAFGVESNALDYNRWQFDLQHFYDFVGVEAPEITPAEKSLELRAVEALEKIAEVA